MEVLCIRFLHGLCEDSRSHSTEGRRNDSFLSETSGFLDNGVQIVRRTIPCDVLLEDLTIHLCETICRRSHKYIDGFAIFRVSNRIASKLICCCFSIRYPISASSGVLQVGIDPTYYILPARRTFLSNLPTLVLGMESMICKSPSLGTCQRANFSPR